MPRNLVQLLGSGWERLGLNIIWPLKITCSTNKRGEEVRHFNLRAVNYVRKKTNGSSTVGVNRDFSERFKLPSTEDTFDFDSWDEMRRTNSRE